MWYYIKFEEKYYKDIKNLFYKFFYRICIISDTWDYWFNLPKEKFCNSYKGDYIIFNFKTKEIYSTYELKENYKEYKFNSLKMDIE